MINTRRYESRSEAIHYEIIEPLTASDTSPIYVDIGAVAEQVIEVEDPTVPNSRRQWICKVGAPEFWAIVQENLR